MKQTKNIFLLVILALTSSVSAKRGQKSKPAIIPKTEQTLTQKKNIVSTPNEDTIKIKYGLVTAQNKRPYQEDRFAHALIKSSRNEDIGEFFAIYDGHGGDKTSSHLQKNLHEYFTEYIPTATNIQAAFDLAFLKAENHALKNFDDGSTAVAAYIDKNNVLHLAWVGDSRAVLEKNGTVAFTTKDHKPDRKDELNRIRLAGGNIEKYGVWRVNGLAISRSIGDRTLKDNEHKDQIIATPEYAEITLTNDNHFLIIASDGLWDIMTSIQAVKFVQEKINNSIDLEAIAHDLQDKAINKGSEDNITVCIVTFNDSKKTSSSRFTRFWNWIFEK